MDDMLMIPIHLENNNGPVNLTPYEPRSCLRGAVITGIVVVIITALALAGKFSFLLQWFRHSAVLWKPLVAAVGMIVILGSVSLIIHNARIGLAQGEILGGEHWKQCMVRTPDLFEEKAHIDCSRLDKTGTGIARIHFKTPGVATISGIMSATLLPIYVSIVITYNIARLITIPFYIIFQIIRETKNQLPLYPEQRRFSLIDIPKQMTLSIGRIVQAPFYGLAMFFVSLCTVVDPLNAIKLGGAIEYDWNAQVPMRNSGIWMVGMQVFKEWQWEGGGGPDMLGRNGFYFAGSWLPYRDVRCVEWKIEEISGVDSVEIEPQMEII